MKNFASTPDIAVTLAAKPYGISQINICINSYDDEQAATLRISAYGPASSNQLGVTMTPTEMLLLADQLTAVALQIEARTAQRELQPTILEAA